MVIKFFESFTNHVGSYTIGIPESIHAEILSAIEGIDRVLPGIQKAMEVSELGIVYDERNRHGIFHSTQRGDPRAGHRSQRRAPAAGELRPKPLSGIPLAGLRRARNPPTGFQAAWARSH